LLLIRQQRNLRNAISTEEKPENRFSTADKFLGIDESLMRCPTFPIRKTASSAEGKGRFIRLSRLWKTAQPNPGLKEAQFRSLIQPVQRADFHFSPRSVFHLIAIGCPRLHFVCCWRNLRPAILTIKP
jgi:hypothetical protein